MSGGAGAKRLAAGTASGVFCVEDVQPEKASVGEGPDEALAESFAVSASATGRARIGNGSAADGDDLIARLGSHAHGLRSWVTEVRCRFPRT